MIKRNNIKGGESMRKLIRKDDGSITLEAAMILPFFMLFIVFLATLIRIAVADMALYKSAAETNEVIVAFAYPVDIASTQIQEIIDKKLQSAVPGDIEVDQLKTWGKEAISFFFGVEVDVAIENFFESVSEDLVLPILQSKFEQAAGTTFFDSSKLAVTNVEIPSLVAGSGDNLQIEVTYEIPIAIPFVNESIILSKTAAERVWNGS